MLIQEKMKQYNKKNAPKLMTLKDIHFTLQPDPQTKDKDVLVCDTCGVRYRMLGKHLKGHFNKHKEVALLTVAEPVNSSAYSKMYYEKHKSRILARSRERSLLKRDKLIEEQKWTGLSREHFEEIKEQLFRGESQVTIRAMFHRSKDTVGIVAKAQTFEEYVALAKEFGEGKRKGTFSMRGLTEMSMLQQIATLRLQVTALQKQMEDIVNRLQLTNIDNSRTIKK